MRVGATSGRRYTSGVRSSDVDRSGFNPWAALRQRDDVELVLARLPAACGGAAYWAPTDTTPTIIIDKSATQIDRNARLCHELIHHDRGLNERGVDDEVARRLVPFAELAAMRDIAVLNELPVECWMVAEKWDVPDDVAERAMRLLLKGDRW